MMINELPLEFGERTIYPHVLIFQVVLLWLEDRQIWTWRGVGQKCPSDSKIVSIVRVAVSSSELASGKKARWEPYSVLLRCGDGREYESVRNWWESLNFEPHAVDVQQDDRGARYYPTSVWFRHV